MMWYSNLGHCCMFMCHAFGSRMGMMGWAFWILCFAVKQYQTFGQVSNAMLVSVLLMEMYIFKFFL